MKNFIHLDCPNQEEIANEIYQYLCNQTDVIANETIQFVYVIDQNKFIEHCGKLRTYLHSIGLPDPKVVHINRGKITQRLHIDEYPETCMMFPVHNCNGTAKTIFYEATNLTDEPAVSKFGMIYRELKYDSIKEVSAYELSSPVMMTPNTPHQVVTTQESLADYRVSARMRFRHIPEYITDQLS